MRCRRRRASPVEPEPLAAAERAAALLADLGHDVREEAPDWEDDGFPAAWMATGTASMRALLGLLERLHGGFDPDGLEPASRAWLIDGPEVPPAAFDAAVEALRAYARRIVDPWPEGSVLVTPTLSRLPAEVQALQARPGVTDSATRFSAFLRVFNVTGQPAISVPVGETTGVQIAGPPGRDDLVLAVAAQLEKALH